jgi:hypothetical protein
MFAEWLVLILQILYTLCTVGLAVYSLNALWLVWQRAAPVPNRRRLHLPRGLPSPCNCRSTTNAMWRNA